MTLETHSTHQKAQHLLNLLRSQAAQERLRAATELKDTGMKVRGAVRTRGAIHKPADKPLPALDLHPALEAINDADWMVRREVALALGEWSDEVALGVLERLAHCDSEWRVREAVAQALTLIGGARAVELLKEMTHSDPHPGPVEQALEGLGDLALATWPEQLPAGRKPALAPRTRGATRGGTSPQPPRISPEVEEFVMLLDEARFHHPDSSVRKAAAETLARLDR